VWKFAPYVLKSLSRNRTRTALTVSGAAVALFVFTFVGAVQEGLARLTRGAEAERTLVVFQANRFCPSTSKHRPWLTAPMERTRISNPGTASWLNR